MEYIQYTLICLLLIPVIIGWIIIGIAPLLVPLLTVIYLMSMTRKIREIPLRVPNIECVLVVDDEYQSVVPLLKLLIEAKVPFKYVAGGLEAIGEISRARFRLIFMDFYMPHLTGMETLKKADLLIGDSTDKTPVVFYSGSDHDDNVAPNFKHLSIVDRWNKSMNLLKLNNRLKNILTTTAS